jgi:hypothetical protein
MRNHAEKQRDMARSVLPSTAREGARFVRRRSHKAARQSVRATLHRVQRAHHPDDIDDPIDRYSIDMGRTTSSYNDEWLVGARRSADKVAPLVRWAGAIIKRTPELRSGNYGIRHGYFKTRLPDTLQGRHALSHLDHLFGSNGDARSEWLDERDRRRQEDRRRLLAAYEDREDKLAAVLAGADERRLNKRIRAVTPPTEVVVRRVYDGSHWIERRTFLPLEPWVYSREDPDRWLGKPRSRDAWLVSPFGGDHVAHFAHRALDEVFAEMFGERLLSRDDECSFGGT